MIFNSTTYAKTHRNQKTNAGEATKPAHPPSTTTTSTSLQHHTHRQPPVAARRRTPSTMPATPARPEPGASRPDTGAQPPTSPTMAGQSHTLPGTLTHRRRPTPRAAHTHPPTRPTQPHSPTAGRRKPTPPTDTHAQKHSPRAAPWTARSLCPAREPHPPPERPCALSALPPVQSNALEAQRIASRVACGSRNRRQTPHLRRKHVHE